jgi:hypothetical protein
MSREWHGRQHRKRWRPVAAVVEIEDPDADVRLPEIAGVEVAVKELVLAGGRDRP